MILYSVLSTSEWKACRCTCCRTRPWRGSYCGGMTLTQVGDFSCLTSCLRCNLKVKLQEYSQWWFEVVSHSPLSSEAAVSVLLFCIEIGSNILNPQIISHIPELFSLFFSFWQTALTSIKYLRDRTSLAPQQLDVWHCLRIVQSVWQHANMSTTCSTTAKWRNE